MLKKFLAGMGALLLLLMGLSTALAASQPPPPDFCTPVRAEAVSPDQLQNFPLTSGLSGSPYIYEEVYREGETVEGCKKIELPAEPPAMTSGEEPLGCPYTREWVVIYPCGSCGPAKRWIGSCWQVVDPCAGYEGPIQCDWTCLRCG